MKEELSCKYIQTEHKDLYMAAVRSFGSWKDAINAAGLDYESIRKRNSWNKAKIIEEIRKVYERGEDLSCSRMQREHSDLEAASYSCFGNWGKAIVTSGLDYDKIRKYKIWDSEKIIEEIKEAYAKGEDLSWYKCSRGKYSSLAHAAIDKNRFGSWRKALEAAGLDYDKIRRYRRWDKRRIKEEIIGELLTIKQKGIRLSDSYIRKKYPALHSAACKIFGSWTKARQSIGDHKNYRKKWTKETIIEEIQKLHKKGIPLTKRGVLINKRIGVYSASLDKSTFGSWIKAKEVALSQVSEG